MSAVHARKSRVAEDRPYAIYTRLSKAKKTGDLETVERQEADCRRYAESRGLTVVAKVYCDPTLSAWKKNVSRPAWNAMMADANAGKIAGILVYRVDRFTRRPRDLEDLIDLAETQHLSIVGPSGEFDLTTAHGRQQARWMGMQASNESDNTSERVKSALAAKMRAGKPMGSGRQFGFKPGGVEPVPEEVTVIRELARRALAGEPLATLAVELNDRGVRTTRGNHWSGQALGSMLSRHRYGGFVEHNGEIVATMAGKPVLDRKTYSALQAMLASRRRGAPPSGRYLLTGLLYCSTCKLPMNGAQSARPRADGHKIREYRCTTARGGCTRTIQAEGVEAKVAARVIELLADPDTTREVSKREKALSRQRKVAADDEAKLVQRLTDLEVKWAKGEVIEPAYKAARASLNADLARVQAAKKAAQEAAKVAPITLALDAAADWQDMTDDERRVLIARLGLRIEIEGFKAGPRNRFNGGRIVIT
jgi:site-specific DNA recombinase